MRALRRGETPRPTPLSPGGTLMAKVLMVEDDPDVRELLEVRVRRMGHRVIACSSGEEALTILADKGAPDVAVLDVLMPGMTGLELLQAMRADVAWSAVPTIFLSGRVQASDIEAGRALGATYLTKPVVLSAQATAIDKALEVDAGDAGSW